MSAERTMRVRLYWADGRVEDLRRSLDVVEDPEIARNTEGRHVHFRFTGHVDVDGFAVYEEQVDD